jgi:t-SNARE complex subunit (syntaxin)
MNQEQRKKIDEIITTLSGLHTDIESIRDEEQDKIDNMTDNMRGGEREQTLEDAVSNLEEAASSVQDAMDKLGDAKG